MAKVKLWKYSRVLEELGLEQLDVYRFKDHEELRVKSKDGGSVFIIKLPRHRETLSLDEFKKIVIESLKSLKVKAKRPTL